jgi:hypothetical protein
MPPKPTVDPELIREILSEDPRPSAAQAAQILSELLGRPVSVALVSAARQRNKDTWQLGTPPVGGGSSPAMDYAHERDLKPTNPQANSLRRRLRCWECLVAQPWPVEPATVWEQRVWTWGTNLLGSGQVVDCVDDHWFVRLAWPWELGHLWAQPRPRHDQIPHELRVWAQRVTVNTDHSMVTVTLTDGHRRMWQEELDNCSCS